MRQTLVAILTLAITGDAFGQTAREINPGGVVNAASFAAGQPVAPGSLASAFGTYPSLQGLSLQFGNGLLALLISISSTQVNFQVPWELTGLATTTLAAVVNGQTRLKPVLRATSRLQTVWRRKD